MIAFYISQWISFQGDPHSITVNSLSGEEDSILWNGAHSNNNQLNTKRGADIEGLSPGDKLLESLESIYKLVQKADTRIKAQERLDEVADQWRMVVAVCDRLLFVVFLSGILVITLWFISIEWNAMHWQKHRVLALIHSRVFPIIILNRYLGQKLIYCQCLRTTITSISNVTGTLQLLEPTNYVHVDYIHLKRHQFSSR